jgi:predicted nucleic acid-binding protein
MKATVDANILFACLIKEGKTRELWFNPELELVAPGFIITEYLKYRKTIQTKSGQTEDEFQKFSSLIITQLTLIPDKELYPYLPAAASLSDDDKDWLYLACAICKDTVLWSNDVGFRNQKRVKVLATAEMVKQVGML